MAAYRAGCATRLSVVFFSYCEGYSCSRAVSLNATAVQPQNLLNTQLFNASAWKVLASLDTSSDPQEQATKSLLKCAVFSNMG